MIDKEGLTRWSLERVQFVLSHIEDFIDDDSKEMRERAKNFSAETGLEKIEALAGCDPQDPHLPTVLLERLSPFFDAGVLIQRLNESGNWWVTDLFFRGNAFHLELKDQVNATSLIPAITPLQVHRAAAAKVLPALKLDFLSRSKDADAFLVKPTPSVAYLLISDFAKPWAEGHMAEAHRLINKCFIY
jgi:hypothetical protein